MPHLLGYRNSAIRPDIDSRHLVTAIACSASPLAANVFIFAIWLFARSGGFTIVAVWIAVVALILFIAGLIALLVHVLTNWAYLMTASDRKAHWKSVVLVALLVIASPLICAMTVYIMSRLTPSLYT